MSRSYYYIHFNGEDEGGVARSCNDIHDIDQIHTSPEGLIQFVLENAVPQDYQANNLGWPLMSLRLRQHLDVAAGERVPHWHRVTVSTQGGVLDYYIPKFVEPIDVLDMERSKIVSGPIGDIIMRACLNSAKVGELEFFPLPGSDIRLVISERLKRNIEKRALTGIAFSSVRIH